MNWMAWTLPSAVFFSAVVLLLIAMTLAELRWPTRSRRGMLPLVTTRGDRLFISLLGAAFVHLLWLAFLDAPVWWATLASTIAAAALMRWG